jgi:hypothetical protein
MILDVDDIQIKIVPSITNQKSIDYFGNKNYIFKTPFIYFINDKIYCRINIDIRKRKMFIKRLGEKIYVRFAKDNQIEEFIIFDNDIKLISASKIF